VRAPGTVDRAPASRPNVAAYNAERLADLELWPVGSIVFPDLRETKVATGS
jgi:hypothetical protein